MDSEEEGTNEYKNCVLDAICQFGGREMVEIRIHITAEIYNKRKSWYLDETDDITKDFEQNHSDIICQASSA